MSRIKTLNDTQPRVVFSSSSFHSISKARQGDDEHATLAVQLVRLGACEEVNAVSPMK
jgi:hypothetical protein